VSGDRFGQEPRQGVAPAVRYSAMRDGGESLRQLLENAHDCILSIDLEGRITYVNPKALELTAASAEELAVTPFTEVIHPEDRQFVLENHLRRPRGEFFAPRYRFRVIPKTGPLRWVELSAVRIQWRGRDATLNFAADVTDWVGAEYQLRQTLQNLRTAVGSIIKTLSTAVETKDPYTAGHQRRVSQLCRAIAVAMGLPPDRVEGVAMAAMIHDIGKIGLPAEILSKPTKLTDIEFSLIKTHALQGYEILKDIEFPWPVADVVLQHHERLDGSGYPDGLKGEDILPAARILSVADVVEAIASNRPYRAANGIDDALAEISKNRGILYDADAVDACLTLFREKMYHLS